MENQRRRLLGKVIPATVLFFSCFCTRESKAIQTTSALQSCRTIPFLVLMSIEHKTFKRNSQTIANRVKKIEAKGAGSTSEFKTFLRQVKPDRLELFSTGKGDEEEEFDKDCINDNEDNLSCVSQAEDEESLSDNLQDPWFETNNTEHPPVDKANTISATRQDKVKPKTATNPKPKALSTSQNCQHPLQMSLGK